MRFLILVVNDVVIGGTQRHWVDVCPTGVFVLDGSDEITILPLVTVE